MSAIQKNYGQKRLLQLIKNNQYKQFQEYIEKISQLNQVAENSVARILQKIFVKKMYKEPNFLYGGLILYKNLLIGAWMDFITDQQLFPQEIHAQIASVCLYNAQEIDFLNRGTNYFLEKSGIEINQKNKAQIQKFGKYFVLLCVQLVAAMAMFYPKDYKQKMNDSIFKRNYNDLVKKKVIFPKKQKFTLIKPINEQNFKKNYLIFQQYLKQVQEQQQNEYQQEVKKKTINEKSIPTEIQKGNSTAVKSNQEEIKQSKPINNDLKNQNTAIIKSNQKPNKLAENNSLNIQNNFTNSLSKGPIETNKKNEISKKKQQQNNANNINNDINKIQTQMLLIDNDLKSYVIGKKTVNPTLNQNKALNVTPKQALPIIDENINKQIYKDNPQSFDKNKEAQKKSEKIEDIAKPKDVITSQAKNEIKKEYLPPSTIINPKKQEQVIIKDNHSDPLQSIKGQKKSTTTFQIQGNFSFKQNKNQQAYKTSNSRLDNSVSSFSKSKVQKTQKPFNSFASTPKKTKMDIEQFKRQQYYLSNLKKKKSLPKTQRKSFSNMALDLQQKIIDSSQNNYATIRLGLNKTLAFYSHKKPMFQYEMIKKQPSLLNQINNMKLDNIILQYYPQYYEPLKSSMVKLRNQSLNLYNSGKSHNYCFENQQISTRLIKLSVKTFLLTIHNKSQSTLNIDYYNMKHHQYSNKIKILSWANRKEIGNYIISKGEFMDIKFTVNITNLNFKFLMFYLTINRKLQQIILPITLLDMCTIQSSVNFQCIESHRLKGTTISSKPFVFSQKQLPSFLGNYSFEPKQSSYKKQLPQLIGQCSIKLQKQQGNILAQSKDLILLTKLLNIQKQLIQLNIIYEKKDEKSQNLSKILLYILQFLMRND